MTTVPIARPSRRPRRAAPNRRPWRKRRPPRLPSPRRPPVAQAPAPIAAAPPKPAAAPPPAVAKPAPAPAAPAPKSVASLIQQANTAPAAGQARPAAQAGHAAPAMKQALVPPPGPATGAPRQLGLATAPPPPATRPIAAVPAPASASPAAAGGYVLQIGAYKSQADAEAAWKTYKARHAALLTGYSETSSRPIWARRAPGTACGSAACPTGKWPWRCATG